MERRNIPLRRSDAVGREVLQQILISCLHGKDVASLGDLGDSHAMIWMNTILRELDLHFKQTGDMNDMLKFAI